jgi:hypothetical protein
MLLWNVTLCNLTGKSFVRNVDLPTPLHRIVSKKASVLLTSCSSPLVVSVFLSTTKEIILLRSIFWYEVVTMWEKTDWNRLEETTADNSRKQERNWEKLSEKDPKPWTQQNLRLPQLLCTYPTLQSNSDERTIILYTGKR